MDDGVMWDDVDMTSSQLQYRPPTLQCRVCHARVTDKRVMWDVTRRSITWGIQRISSEVYRAISRRVYSRSRNACLTMYEVGSIDILTLRCAILYILLKLTDKHVFAEWPTGQLTVCCYRWLASDRIAESDRAHGGAPWLCWELKALLIDTISDDTIFDNWFPPLPGNNLKVVQLSSITLFANNMVAHSYRNTINEQERTNKYIK